jgi:hypothetical protein
MRGIKRDRESSKKSHTTAALHRVADNTQLLATAVDSHAGNAPELISARIAARTE